MHSFNIDICVGKRFLETYAIHLISKYLLRRVAALHGIKGIPMRNPIELEINVFGDATRLTISGLADFFAEVYPNTVSWVPEYETNLGLTRVRTLSRWAELQAPKALELTTLDQDFVARGLDMGYAQAPMLTERDAQYFIALRDHIVPAMEPDTRSEFDSWFEGMCAQAAANRQQHKSVVVDELPFIPNNPSRQTFFSNPERDERFAAALRSMDGRITSIDIIPSGRSLLSSGPQSRQQFRNDREAPSRGKKGRVKMFANKNGAVYPKPGGTRGY